MAIRNKLGWSAEIAVTATGSTVSAAFDVGAFKSSHVCGQVIWDTSSGSITVRAANATATTVWTDLFTIIQTGLTRKQSTVSSTNTGGTFRFIQLESTNIKTTAGAVVHLAIV